MNPVVAHIEPIMRIAGALTFTMVFAALAPQQAVQSTFGEPLHGPVADVVVRNWGALIALVGAMLLYGAGRPPVRPLVLAVAAASKAVFIGLVLAQGARFLGHQAGIAILVDAVMVALFSAYLLGTRRARPQEAGGGRARTGATQEPGL